MKNYKPVTLLFVILLLSISNNSFSQTYGKLYTKSEADSLYGPVLFETGFSPEQVNSFIGKTGDVLMFRFKDDQVIILDDNRNLVYPAGAQVNPTDVFSVYSISLINELMNKGSSGTVLFQRRQHVFSITDGLFTLEYATLCPPWCP